MDIQELREVSASQLADAKAQIVAIVTELSRSDETMHDSNVIMENQRATIRAFASDAESILTCSLSEPTRIPSLQVSALISDSTRSASFVTAWTSAAQGEATNNTVYPRQLMIPGIGRGTTVLQSSQFRYGHQVMVAMEERTLVPTIYFRLTYAGKAIGEMTDMSSVPHDAAIYAHYRAFGEGGRMWNYKPDLRARVDDPQGSKRRLDTLEEEGFESEFSSDADSEYLTWKTVDEQRKKKVLVITHKQVPPRVMLWKRVGRRVPQQLGSELIEAL